VARRLIIIIGGVVAAVAAYLALPGFRSWVLRLTGRRSDREYYEDVEAEPVAPEDAAGETDELRLSLRARLAESGPAPDVEDVAAANSGAAEAGPPEATTIDEARARVRAKARDAKRRLTETDDQAAPKSSGSGEARPDPDDA
jgi:hypothetical protein